MNTEITHAMFGTVLARTVWIDGVECRVTLHRDKRDDFAVMLTWRVDQHVSPGCFRGALLNRRVFRGASALVTA